MKNAARNGANNIGIRATISQYAWRSLPFKSGGDIALLNGMIHVIITNDLVDKEFINERVACEVERTCCGLHAESREAWGFRRNHIK